MLLRRRILSAAIAAALLAANLVLLALILNPEIEALPELPALAIALFLPYWVLGFLGMLALALLLGLFRFWPANLRAPLPGLPSFAAFAFMALAVASELSRYNREALRDALSAETVFALGASAVCLAVSAGLLVLVSLNAILFPSRRRGLSAALVVLCAASSVVVPMALRPHPVPSPPPVAFRAEPARPPRRVILVGLDGLSAGLLRERAALGRQPGLARLLRRGASGPLRTLVPTLGPAVWTSIVTGRLPRDHGVKSYTRYRLRGSATLLDLLPRGALVSWLERAGFVVSVPLTAGSRHCRAVWEALNAYAIQAGVVRLYATHPAEPIQGFMLSNYFHVLSADPARGRASLHPPDLFSEIAARAVSGHDVDAAFLPRFFDRPPPAADGVPWRSALVDRALLPDLTYERAGRVLRTAYAPPFFATSFSGLDVVARSFLRYARADEFGDVTDAQARRYGPIVDRYLGLVGEWLSDFADRLDPDDVLLVVSGYGMQPVPTWRRGLSVLLGVSDASAQHAPGGSGFLLAIGTGIKPGAVPSDASVLDVTPTILYLMGLPVARDMEGRALVEMLSDAAVARPLTFIPSYESLAVARPRQPVDPDLPPLSDEVP